MPKVPERRGRPEQLAVNIFDLTDKVHPLIREALLAGKLETDRSKIVRADKDKLDETAVILICPLLDAAVALDIIRDHDRKAKDCPTRAYLRRKPGAAWVKLSAGQRLTADVGGKLVLAPDLFGAALEVQAPKHQAEAVEF